MGFFYFMAKENLKMIKIAYVARPHGIKGEAELSFLEENVFEEGMEIHATAFNEKSQIPKAGMKLTIQKLKVANKAIVTFKEVTDRTMLEKLIPFELSVAREDLPQDEFYLFDLPGMNVVSESGETLGEVLNVFDNGAQEVLEIQMTEGERIMLPFVENFFPEVDLEHNHVVMILPEYTE